VEREGGSVEQAIAAPEIPLIGAGEEEEGRKVRRHRVEVKKRAASRFRPL
jgi:hypothetical protein